MKFLVVLCLLAVAAADEDKVQDKKTQPFDTTQNASTLTQPNTSSLLNGQVFPPTAFSTVFASPDPALQLAYSTYNGNVSPIQSVNPDFFAAPAQPVVNAPIPTFPVTRTVLTPTTGIQNAFPVAANVFPPVAQVPSGVNPIPSQFPAVGILSPVQSVPNAAPNPAPANPVIQTVPAPTYRFLTPEGYSALPAQALQPASQVALSAIPAFTGGILPSLGNNILQGQNLPAGLQQIIPNPAGTASAIPNGLPAANVFRQA